MSNFSSSDLPLQESKTQSVWHMPVQVVECCVALVINLSLFNIVKLRVHAKTYIVHWALYHIGPNQLIFSVPLI